MIKGKKCIVIAIILCNSMLATSCGNVIQNRQNQDVEQQMKEAKGDAQEILKEARSEKISENNYDNISFCDDFYVDVPENVADVSTFTLKQKEKLKGKEIEDSFFKVMDTYQEGIYNEADKKKMIMVTSEDLYSRLSKGDIEYQMPYYYFEQYKNDISAGTVIADCLWYDNQKGSISLFSTGRCDMDKGTVARMDHQKKTDDYLPAEHHDICEYISVPYQFSGEQAYTLCDGKNMKVKDAVRLVENHLNNEYPLRSSSDLEAKVANMKVIEVKDGIFDYSFSTVFSYNGVRFDCANMQYQENAVSFIGNFEDGESYSDGKDYNVFPANINVANNGQIDSIRCYNDRYDVINEKKYDKIISLKQAFDIISKQLSKELQLECSSAEFIYCRYNEKKDDESVQQVYPVWKITSFNKKDHFRYYLYINALDGSFHYAMDQIEEKS